MEKAAYDEDQMILALNIANEANDFEAKSDL